MGGSAHSSDRARSSGTAISRARIRTPRSPARRPGRAEPSRRDGMPPSWATPIFQAARSARPPSRVRGVTAVGAAVGRGASTRARAGSKAALRAARAADAQRRVPPAPGPRTRTRAWPRRRRSRSAMAPRPTAKRCGGRASRPRQLHEAAASGRPRGPVRADDRPPEREAAKPGVRFGGAHDGRRARPRAVRHDRAQVRRRRGSRDTRRRLRASPRAGRAHPRRRRHRRWPRPRRPPSTRPPPP